MSYVKEFYLKESETDAEIVIPVVCSAGKEYKETYNCKLGQKECVKCVHLIWTGMGYVQPLPEPMDPPKRNW
jgi:hypothetical protein